MFTATVTHRPLPRAVVAVLATLAMLATLLVGSATPAFADATLTVTPPDPDNDPSPMFEFTIAGTDGATCAVDGGAPVACDSPYRVPTPLPDGEHTFSVQEVDIDGEPVGDPALHTWTVDTTPPVATIAGTPADDAVTNETATSHTFSTEGDEEGATVTCELVGTVYGSYSTELGHCEGQTLEANLSGQDDQVWTWTATATDAAGNVQTERTSLSWTQDTTSPTTTLTVVPDDPTNNPDGTFEWTVDEEATTVCDVDGPNTTFTQTDCTSPLSFIEFSDGEWIFTFTSTDVAGNVESPTVQYRFTIDTVAPDTEITFKPAARTSDTTAAFTFTSDEDPDVTYECTLTDPDLGTVSEVCSSPVAYENLIDGEHTFEVVATDLAGNSDETPAEWTWVVDSTAPTTTIDSAPEGTVATTDATIEFSTDDAGGAMFACRLDDADFADCTSPVEYTALPDGPHTFEVKASDDLGNTEEPPASATWTVDTTPGDTTIQMGPDELTNLTDAHFTFTTEDSPATFECQLDGAGFGPCPTTPPLTNTRTVAVRCLDACATSGTADYAGLPDGEHTFEVRALDGVGNTDPTPATFTWTIDTAVPNTFITTPPDVVETSRSVSIPFTSDDETATFECDLDDVGWEACTSPFTADDLADGSHTFEVRAGDGAGNVDDSPATATWTVDATAPDTILTSAPSGTVAASEASFSFASDDEGASFQCALDAGSFAACTSPVNLTVADGEHTFKVRALDAAGNLDATPAVATWVADTVGPTLTIDSGPSGFVATGDATFVWSTTEMIENAECRLDDGDWETCGSTVEYSDLDDGTHLFQVHAEDEAGNLGPTASQSWTVDTTAPNTILTSRPSNGTSTTARITFTATEVSTFACSLDGGAYAVCTSPRSLTGLSVGVHTFRVRATDRTGNTDPTPAVASWRVDAPTEPTGAERFTDVDEDNKFSASIGRLAASGVTRGCNEEGTKFCPKAFVTRGEMAAFFTRAQNLPAGTKVFSDTRGHRFQADIAAFERRGITKGCNDAQTKFCPDDFVTRGQMAAFFTRAQNLPAGTKVFSDTRGHQFQADIAAFERRGITKGCNDAQTKFCPDDFVTREQMAAFFDRAGLLD